VDLPPDYSTTSHDESESGEQELYVALRGSGSVDIDGVGLPLDAGHLVRVDAGTPRSLSSGPDGLRVLCIGGVPGAAYEPPEWSSATQLSPRLHLRGGLVGVRLALAFPRCGPDLFSDNTRGRAATTAVMTVRVALAVVAVSLAACGGGTAASAGTGTGIVVGSSQFGRMLFNADRQAIYVFGRDSRNLSRCYDECAALWPPVYTSSRPRALAGAKKSLLGTTRRRDGRVQATYAGRPLYYYAHEGPGQVLCHDVMLNGGIWKVVAPSGRPRR
jgi:predicted lipoprotein with Yx(FWY)xxD motif